MGRKGELSAAGIDHGWPHRVAVEVPDGYGLGPVAATGPLSSPCPGSHELAYRGKRYRIFASQIRNRPNASARSWVAARSIRAIVGAVPIGGHGIVAEARRRMRSARAGGGAAGASAGLAALELAAPGRQERG